MIEKNINTLPNAYYDIIVFFSSSLLFVSLILWGFGVIDNNLILKSNIEIKNIVFVFVILFFFSYEYGRMAEALSAIIVQTPLSFLLKHNILKNKDFLSNLPNIEESLKLEIPKKGRKGGKWTVYYYAMLTIPSIGNDLLKRYAWEKLSRNSAFTFMILFLVSLGILISNLIMTTQILYFGDFRFGTISFTLILFFLVNVSYYEYYKRNSWNNDLILKVLTVLSKAEEISYKSNDTVLLKSII